MKKIIIIILLFTNLFVISCDRAPRQNILRIGYSDFSFDQAIVFVIKGILDQQPNLIVELYKVSDELMFSSLANDELDVGISAWLPHTHKMFFEQYPYEIRRHSVLTDSLGLYMVVPETININSISEMNQISAVLRNTILIPESQNAIYQLSQNIIEDYNLSNFTLQEVTWDNIITFVDDSVRNNSGFAFISLRPHHSYRRFNLKALNDPRGALGNYEQAYIVVNSKFPEKMPIIADFLSQIRFSLDDIEFLMDLNQTLGSEPYENALRWINQNTFKINRWLLGDRHF